MKRDLADVGQGVLAAVTAGAFYAVCACRTIYTGDSAELATAAAVFGIPHPPGYPLYTGLTGVMARLLPVASPAFAANLVTAGYGAAAVGLFFLVLRRAGITPVAAWVGTATLALGRTYWAQGVAAEVYSFDVLLLVLVAHAVLFRRREATPAAWLWIGLATGLWIGHRIVNLLYLPAVVLAVWAVGTRVRGRAAGAALAGLAVSLMPLLYLPIAAMTDPYVNIGDPRTWAEFLWVINPAKAYGHHLESGTAALDLGRLAAFFRGLPVELGVGVVLAPLGVMPAFARSRRAAFALCWIVVANVAFAIRYNVIDFRVYFIPAYVALAVLTALGADALLGRPKRLRRVAAASLAAASILGLPLGWATNDLSGNDIMYAMATDLLQAAGPSGVLLVRGDNTETGPGYLQAVEGRGSDVIVLDPIQWDSFDWYRRGIARRHPEVAELRAAATADSPPRAEALIRRLARSRSIHSTYEPIVSEHLAGFTFRPAGMTEAVDPDGRVPSPERVAIAAQALIEVVGRLPRVEPQADINTQVIYGYYAFALYNTAGILLSYPERRDLAAAALEAVVGMEPDAAIRAVYDARDGIGRAHPEILPAEQSRAVLQRLP